MNGALSALVKGESGSWTPETVRTNFDLLITRGDYRLAKHAAVILLKGENGNVLRDRTGNLQLSDVTSKAGGKKATALAVAAAAAAEEEATQVAGLQAACVNSLCSLLRGDWDGGGDTEISHWYPAAQMGIDAIFHLSPAPIAVLTAVIHAQAAGLTVPRDASSELNAPRLSRLCFTLGHTAVRFVVFVLSFVIRNIRLYTPAFSSQVPFFSAYKYAGPWPIARQSLPVLSRYALLSVSAVRRTRVGRGKQRKKKMERPC